MPKYGHTLLYPNIVIHPEYIMTQQDYPDVFVRGTKFDCLELMFQGPL